MLEQVAWGCLSSQASCTDRLLRHCYCSMHQWIFLAVALWWDEHQQKIFRLGTAMEEGIVEPYGVRQRRHMGSGSDCSSGKETPPIQSGICKYQYYHTDMHNEVGCFHFGQETLLVHL